MDLFNLIFGKFVFSIEEFSRNTVFFFKSARLADSIDLSKELGPSKLISELILSIFSRSVFVRQPATIIGLLYEVNFFIR